MTDETTHIATAAASLDDLYAALSQHLHGDGDGDSPPPLRVVYRNWRGEVGERNIIPHSVWFGATEWHSEPQWLLSALDTDKWAARDFALADFGANDDTWRTRALAAEAELTRLRSESERMRDGLDRIVQWSMAYPLSAFPEPDSAEVCKALAAAGLSVDAVSASNMRHVVVGVGEIARAALAEGGPDAR